MIVLAIPDGMDKPSYRAPLSVQLSQLMYRSWVLAQREPRISRAKLFQTAIVVFFLIPTFWQLNDWSNCDGYTVGTSDYNTCMSDNATEFHSMIGAMYFLCVM